MNMRNESRIPEIVKKYHRDLLDEWVKEQIAASTFRPDLMSTENLREQSSNFLGAFVKAAQSGNLTDIMRAEWKDVREVLDDISTTMAEKGFSPSETAMFVFSFKQPFFVRLTKELQKVETLTDEVWTTTALLDNLGLYTLEAYQRTREQVIQRQRMEIHELSTPVVQLWQGILSVPLIGTLDSVRTQVVMENLLQRIADTGSTIAIIDITGVPAVDTQVAQHLLKTVAAARLMGADCIVSGIRPQIAQTIVSLGVKFDFLTKASLADALEAAFQATGQKVSQTDSRS